VFVPGSAELAEEGRQVRCLSEAREVGGVVQPHVEHAPHLRVAEHAEERLRASPHSPIVKTRIEIERSRSDGDTRGRPERSGAFTRFRRMIYAFAPEPETSVRAEASNGERPRPGVTNVPNRPRKPKAVYGLD
jgi:hypothetical protein